MRFLALLVIVLAVIAAGCGGSKKAASSEPVQKYKIHGVIEKLDPKGPSATIKHDKIEGFMDAMTMEFPIKNKDEFAKLRTGQVIDGTVFVQDVDYWVGDIRESK